MAAFLMKPPLHWGMGWGHPSLCRNNWNGVWQQQLWLSGAGLKLQPQGNMYFYPFYPTALPAPGFHTVLSGSWFTHWREGMFYVWINDNSPRTLKRLTCFFFGKKGKKYSRCFEFSLLVLGCCWQLLCHPWETDNHLGSAAACVKHNLDNQRMGQFIKEVLPTFSH